MEKKDQISYLLSFLQILILRNNGKLVIEHLSEFSGSEMILNMQLDLKNDRVILRAEMKPLDKKKVL